MIKRRDSCCSLLHTMSLLLASLVYMHVFKRHSSAARRENPTAAKEEKQAAAHRHKETVEAGDT